ncbi:MAG: hypothetical protein WBD81_14600 [Collimonas pratensis]
MASSIRHQMQRDAPALASALTGADDGYGFCIGCLASLSLLSGGKNLE